MTPGKDGRVGKSYKTNLQVTPRQKGAINSLTGGPGVTDASRPPCCFLRHSDDVLTAKQECLPVQNHWVFAGLLTKSQT